MDFVILLDQSCDCQLVKSHVLKATALSDASIQISKNNSETLN